MSLHDEVMRRFPALRMLPPGCFAVGGAIRDLLRGASPADVDVACPDPHAAARAISERVIRLGDQQHLSAWRVVADDVVYDFAAIEGGTMERDLARRDFTVNAIAVSLDDGAVLDPFDGRGDLERGLVRMVRASNFADDPLRTLRAVRLAVKLELRIEEATIAAVREHAPRIGEVAVERVMAELTALFSAGAFRRAVALLERTGLCAPLGFRCGHFAADDVGPSAAFALLVPEPRPHAGRWRWSDALLREVLTLQRLTADSDLLALYDAGEAIAVQLPAMLRALGRDDRIDMPDFSVRALLTGEEIATLTGLEPGPVLGATKRALLEAQVRGRVRDREDAIAFVRTLSP